MDRSLTARTEAPAEPDGTGTSEFPMVDLRAARQARVAIAITFFTDGAIFGDWVSRVPAIKEQVGAGNGALGAALLGISVGSVLARPLSGQLVARHGSRRVTRLAIVCGCLALLLPALATNIVTLALALIGFGAGLGSIDVAMNAHAVAVQARLGRPILSSLHGVYSIGGLAGALAGAAFSASGVRPLVHFGVVALVIGALTLLASRWLLPSAFDVASRAARAGRWVAVPRDQRFTLIALGTIGLCSMAGEGAVGDWGAIYLHENLGAEIGLAATGFAVYSVAMVTVRLLGDRLLARWDAWRVITWSATAAGVGFALALAIGRPFAALAGFAVLGVGLSLVVPATFSKAGELGGGTTGPALTVVSLISGLGPIAVPPVIGFLAEGTGLPAALGIVSALAFVAVALMRVVQTRPRPGDIAAHRAARRGAHRRV